MKGYIWSRTNTKIINEYNTRKFRLPYICFLLLIGCCVKTIMPNGNSILRCYLFKQGITTTAFISYFHRYRKHQEVIWHDYERIWLESDFSSSTNHTFILDISTEKLYFTTDNGLQISKFCKRISTLRYPYGLINVPHNLSWWQCRVQSTTFHGSRQCFRISSETDKNIVISCHQCMHFSRNSPIHFRTVSKWSDGNW